MGLWDLENGLRAIHVYKQNEHNDYMTPLTPDVNLR